MSTDSQSPVLPHTGASVSLLVVCASGGGTLDTGRCLLRTKLIPMTLTDFGNDFSREHFKNEEDNFHVVKIADILSLPPSFLSSLFPSLLPGPLSVCLCARGEHLCVWGGYMCKHVCVHSLG